MKKTLLQKLWISCFAVLLLFSCNEGILFEKNLPIKHGEWNRLDKAVFTFDVEDSLSRYAIYLNVRHAGDYPYKNLYLFTKTISPGGQLAVDTAQMIFANSRGEWLGKGIGDIYDYQFKFKKEVIFPEVGEFKFEIEQAMRDSILPNITDIGVKIEKVER